MSSPYSQRPATGGSAYATKSSGGGSPYAGKPSTTAAKKKKGRHGVLGFVENLGTDAVQAVAGLPAGLVQTAEHPVRTAKAVGKQYAQTYGPLTHGDVSTFLHNVYSHPLGPILDLATVITGGAGLGAKAGLLSSEARLLALRSPAEFGANIEGTVGRLTSRNPAVRGRERLVHELKNKLPYTTPHIGEAARYGREATRLDRINRLKLERSPEARAYNKAVRKLDDPELVALHLIGNNIHPLDYADALRKLQAEGEHVEPSMFKVLDNKKVQDAFDHPSARLTVAVDAADAFSKLDASVKIAHGQLTPETATARAGRHAESVKSLLGETRPTPERPFYVPDVRVQQKVANAAGRKMGGGKSTPKNIVFANHGTLFRTGQLLLNHDVLGPEFMKTLKYGLADDVHATLMKGAARISKDEANAGGVPKGWEFIPKDVVSKLGRKRSQKIPVHARQANQQLRETEAMFPLGEHLADSFKVTDLKDAARLHGDYLIAPSSLIKEVTGEFTRSTSVIHAFLNKPFQVWRALVLGLRVGFLTNNIVGNHLIYAIKAAGPDGLRAYLNAVRRVHGESTVRSLIQMKGVPEPLRQQFMDEFFPEQSAHATFGKTQKPQILKGKKGRAVEKATAGVFPAAQAASETILRRALVEHFVRKSPEFKKVYRALPRDTRDFELAAKKIVKGDGGPQYQERISRQVDDSLGNYLNMNKLEQDVLRQILPFYSWYKAITRITAHIALDTPGRANILAKIGQIGAVDTQAKLGPIPDYLLNLLPLGKNENGELVLATRGLNPFTTVTDIGAGVAGLATGQPGETGKAFTQLGPNPFLLGAIQNLSGKELFTGRDLKGGQGGLFGQIAEQTIAQLPQSQLAKALAGRGRKSKLYGKQTGREAVLQFLGAPVKTLRK